MLVYLISTLVLSSAFAQLHNVCHSNINQLIEEEVVALFADIVDRNGDQQVTPGEFVIGFKEIFHLSLPVPDSFILGMDMGTLVLFGGSVSISKDQFVEGWHTRFGDDRDFVRATFDAYDENKDGQLKVVELEHIINHIKEVSDNGDGKISVSELKSYLLWVYNNC